MDGKLYKKIIYLTIPAVIEFALRTMVNYVDYIMVGKLGANAAATIGLTSEISWMMKAGVTGVSVGVVAYISKAVGMKKYEKINPAVRQALYLSVIIGTLTFIVCMAISGIVPSIMGAEEALKRPASIYFIIVSLPYIFFAVNTVFGSVLKAVGDMVVPLVVNGIMNIINIILNFFFIYPTRNIVLFGRTIRILGCGWGVNGAALATTIATVFGGVCMYVVVIRRKEIDYRETEKSIDKKIIVAYIRVGIPVFFSYILMCGGRVIFTGMISRLGTIMYVAHTLAFSTEGWFYMPSLGLNTAITTLAGNANGEKDIDKLNKITKYSCIMVAVIMALMSAIMLIFADQLIAVMTSDPEVRRIAPTLLRIVALNEPLFGVSVVMEGVFNGIGKTKYTFWVNTITQWLIRVTGTVIFVYLLHGTVYTAWICMITENIVRALVFLAVYIIDNKKLIAVKNMITFS